MSSALCRSYPLLVALMLFIMACSNESTSSAQDEPASYKVGQPLTDTSLVAIVSSDAGSDTLRTQPFNNQIQRLTRQFPQVMLDPDQANLIRREIIKQFVLDHVIAAEAMQRNINIVPTELEDAYNDYKRQFPSDSLFEAEMKAQGQDDAEIRAYLAKRLRLQSLMDQIKDELPAPSAKDIETYQAQQSVQIKAQHILIMVEDGADEATRKTARERAQVLLDSAKAGVDFAELAKRHSQDPGSAYLGGDLSYFKRGDMVKSFEEAAFALPEIGAITPNLVESPFGYHIIRLVDRKQDSTLDLETAGTQLLRKKQNEAVNNLFTRLQSQATVRVNPNVIAPESLN